MNLPKLFAKDSQIEEKQTFIGLIVSDFKVQALLINSAQGKIAIESKSRVLEYDSIESAPIKADEVIQDLGEGSESINKTIYCLDASWIKDDDIDDKKKALIKKINDDLGLEAVGFVVTSESLVNHHVIATPTMSGIFLMFSTQTVTADLVIQGSIKGHEEVGRSDNSVADIEEALARFAADIKNSGQPLPAQMVLASFELMPEDLRKQQQQLLEYNWVDQGVFIRTPTIEMISQEEMLEILAHQSSRAMNIDQGEEVVPVVAPSAIPADEPEIEQELPEPVPPTPPTPTTPEELDSESIKINETKLSQSQETEDEELAVSPEATSFGVPIKSSELPDLKPEAMAKSGSFEDEFKSVSSKNIFNRLLYHWHKPYEGDKTPKHFALMGLIGGGIALLIIGLLSILFSVQANIEIVTEKKVISEDIEITVDPSIQATDPESGTLAVKEVSKEISGQSTLQTTGIKLVGDSATGTVRIYNKTSSQKTFPQGTELTSGGYSFLTDSEITIASASSQPKDGGEVVDYGQAEVGVTAVEIGEEGNLAEDTDFTVENFDTSSYSATSIDAFSGGASREVRVVAEEDLEELLTDLREELLGGAAEEFKKDAKDGLRFLVTNDVEDETARYSAEVGDEATDLQLDLSIQVVGYSYSAQDILPIVQQYFSEKIPDGYLLSEEDPQILSDSNGVGGDGDEVKLSANVSVYAIPDLDQDSLKSQVSGKSVDDAIGALVTVDGVESATIEIQPNYARFFVRSLPRNMDKINLTLK